MSANPLAMIVAKKSWQNTATTWLLLLFTVFGFTDAFGQVANYTFSESPGTYTTIAGTTAIASGWDDTVTANTIPIGFTFNFNGTNYTTCSINSNGYITFGATLSANNLYTPISDNTGYNGAISGFGVDLTDNNTRTILYTTTGTAPNRIFTVQWREARRFAQGGNLDFQIKLFETSNRIDIVYANFGLNNTNVNVQVGLRGANNTDFNNRSLTATNTAWDNNTTAGGANNATCRSRNNNQPSNGRTFTWTPPTPPTITSLGAASGCVGSTLTINGTNLLTATAVTIGGTAATITGTTATSVTVTVGTGTTGTVQVTTPGGTATSAATFTVNPLPTISLTSAVGTNAQTLCINTAITNITYTVAGGGATGATVTGLPAGVTGNYSAGTVTISGTPSASGTFNYTITTTGGTCSTTANGTITVRALPTIVLTSAAATANQSICRGSAITNIVYTIGGGATGVTTAGLPAGVTGNLVGSTYTLSGTPTANGTFNYTLTTSGGAPCANATINGTLVVNALPANPGNPTSNSPQCNPPGVTLTRTGTPPAGETWYWQTVAGGTNTTNSGATFVATTSGTYYLRAQNNTSGCWSAGSGSLAITITPSLSAVAGTPAPTNAATGICYAGGSTLTDLTWNAVAGATSYDVYFGAGSLPGTAIANVATNSYTLGTLNANTTYYWQVVPRNACGATSGTPATWTFTTSNAPCVCVPTATTDDVTGITNVTFNTINNTTTGNAAYTNTGISTTVTGTNIYPLSVSVNTGGAYTVNVKAWIDWDNNGLFTDPGEEYNLGSATNGNPILSSLSPLNISIPNIVGSFKMRVRASYNTAPTPCGNQNYSEAEDYTIVVTAPPACTTPTAAPTALALSAGTPNGTAINGSFTAAAPAPQNYLVIVSTSNTAPAISNGTTYTTGGNAGAGYTVVDTDANTTFTASGLNPSTTYYFYIYSMNNLCSGGPLYNATPLTGNLTTGATVPTYCNATTNTPGTRYIDDISFLGMLNGNIYNLNTGFTTTPAPGGYQDWTGLATKPRQAQGGGVNISFESNSRGTWKAWVDWNKDGDFTDAGELVYTSAGVAMITNTFGFIIPNGATPGDYRVRIRTYNAFGNYNPMGNFCDDPSYEYYGDGAGHFDSCTPLTTYSQNITSACGTASVNFTEYGEAEDYLFTVVEMCEANIVTVTNGEICGPGTVNVSVTGTPGTTQYRWYSAETGGALLATTATGSWTTPVIATTTSYWVTAFNGSCESLVRTEVIAKISPLPTITFTPSVPEVCGENNVVSITAGGDTELVYLIDEGFEGAGLGVFSNDHITSTAYNTQTAWQKKTSTYIPNGSSWYPAISSNFGANHFALVTSDIGTNGTVIHNALLSPSVNTNTFLDLTLTFRMYFSRYYPDNNNPTLEYMNVEVSDNGGAWTSISGGNIITDQGYGTDFKEFSYDMSAYINKPNIRVRIRYYAGDWYDGAAVDDIKLFGKRPLNTSFNWTSVLPVDAYSDAACTTNYVAGTPAVTVYIKPTMAQLEQTTYSFTATAVLNNGCSASSLVSINNKSKVWKGGTNGDWNNPNNWSPVGVPDATTCVIIPPAANTSNVLGTNYNGFGKTLQVVNGGSLTIQPSNTLTITDFVEVRGATSIFNIENTASLIQVNNVANSGTISMKRNASIKALDYVYWSSPVASFASNAISPATPASVIWKWEPTTATAYASQFGNWVNGVETMSLGRGYIVRSPNGWPSTPSVFTANFVGVPNNGNITRPITRSTYTGANYAGPTATPVTANDDNWNLLGNPYPSAISADAFLTANLTHINPFVDLWKHGNAPAAIASPFYQNYQLNYNPNDYLRYNRLGGTQFGFDGKIGAGQGFFVLMRDAGATTENAIFNNSMRSNTHRNDQFFRTTESNVTTTDFESHRIWLMMVAPNLVSSDILVGYATGAQNNFDEAFDAMNRGVKINYELYSLADDKGLSIQGRALPFDANDQIPLGVKIAQNGIHTIAISAADGLFGTTTQDIYLEDRTLGITHDLRTVPYSFTATPGTYENRFVLKFNNETLGNEDFTANAVTVYTDDNINVTATNQTIKSVRVHDLLGKVIGTFNNVNAETFSTRNVAKTQSPLLVEVTLENGATKTYKVIF